MNNDFAIGITDVAAINSAILFDPNNLDFDANGDGVVNNDDVDTLLSSFIANLQPSKLQTVIKYGCRQWSGFSPPSPRLPHKRAQAR